MRKVFFYNFFRRGIFENKLGSPDLQQLKKFLNKTEYFARIRKSFLINKMSYQRSIRS